jgi:2-dehydro-3-deoxyglucarate aldolase/4-hydroxy-2-oxoheptanedioate aldolase
MSFQEYVDTANHELVIVVQVEHIQGVRNIDAIVDVPGIDVVFVGPFDLSGSLRLIGQIDHPKVLQAIDQTKQYCEKTGTAAGLFAVDAQSARDAIESGFRLIAVGMDSIYLWRSAKATLDEIRGGVK